MKTEALVPASICLAVGLAACGGGIQRGDPISDPPAIALEAAMSTGIPSPVRVVFKWEYADDRGGLRGDGAARVNPPDRFRLDLIGTAEESIRATLTQGQLLVAGRIEDVEFPPPTFLYAMTGVFRPGPGDPVEGFRSGEMDVLGYAAGEGAVRYFYFDSGRLQRVEERSGNRMQRRIVLEWGEDPSWPREARYRDDLTRNVVRWELDRVVPQEEDWSEDIYDIVPIH